MPVRPCLSCPCTPPNFERNRIPVVPNLKAAGLRATDTKSTIVRAKQVNDIVLRVNPCQQLAHLPERPVLAVHWTPRRSASPEHDRQQRCQFRASMSLLDAQ